MPLNLHVRVFLLYLTPRCLKSLSALSLSVWLKAVEWLTVWFHSLTYLETLFISLFLSLLLCPSCHPLNFLTGCFFPKLMTKSNVTSFGFLIFLLISLQETYCIQSSSIIIYCLGNPQGGQFEVFPNSSSLIPPTILHCMNRCASACCLFENALCFCAVFMAQNWADVDSLWPSSYNAPFQYRTDHVKHWYWNNLLTELL